MGTERPSKDQVFNSAAELADPLERAEFLDMACAGNPDLRIEMEDLLARDREAASFLQSPPSDLLASAPRSATIETPATIEMPGAVIGPYKLLEQIGEGGFGVVYMAEQGTPVRRKVALKIIKPGMDTKEVVARFEAERQALALMDHPNIARVFDGGTTASGRPYFVMELVHGVPITTYCDGQKLMLPDRLKLFIDVCRAVQHAHQKGVIHRDLKPSNVMVTLHDDKAVPKVIDFGVAKAVDQPLTERTLFTGYGQMIGTPMYMSPEQAQLSGLDVDTRSDIYSLGVLLYELITGTTPFDEATLRRIGFDEMRRIIREDEPRRPSDYVNTLKGDLLSTVADRRQIDPRKLSHSLRGELDWIVMKALEKDRNRRYESVNDLAADIERYLNDETVQARPPSLGYKLAKMARRYKRKPALAASLLLSAILLLVVAIGAPIAVVRIHRQRETAEYQLYAANMNVARYAWDDNNVGLLRRKLEETKNSPHRGFEWYYWQRQAHLATRTLAAHADAVLFVAFSPDGKRIFTGSFDQAAKVWDADSGRELFELKRDPAAAGLEGSVCFSPNGSRIVTGNEEGRVSIWDAATGRKLIAFKAHNERIECMAFSRDGTRFVTGSADKTAKVWDASSGRNLHILEGHSDAVFAAAFSPDGLRILTGTNAIGSPGTAQLWDLSNDHQPITTFMGHTGGLFCAAFSPDGNRIVTSGRDHTAYVWDASTGNELFQLQHGLQIEAVAWSPDGQRIVTGSEDQTAKLWDAASGRELQTLKGHTHGITSIAFSPDGKRVATGSLDQTVKIWDVGGSQEPFVYRGHTDQVWSAAFSTDAALVVTGSWDSTANVWEAASGRDVLQLAGHDGPIVHAAFSAEGEWIATGSWDTTIRIWDAKTGVQLRQLKGHRGTIQAVAFSPDRKQIASSSTDVTARVWDTSDEHESFKLMGHTDKVYCAAFSPDGEQIVTASLDGTAKIWDAKSGREIRTLKGHRGEVYAAVFSPDGTRIVTGGDISVANVWDAATGRKLFELTGHSLHVMSVDYARDGRRILTGSWDGTAKLWDAATGRELLTLKGHSGGVVSVDFAPDGSSVVTASTDGTARIWKAAQPQQVARWRSEDQAVVQKLERLERGWLAEKERARAARAQDEGRIKRWLVLAPIQLASGQSGVEGLDVEQIAGEARFRPLAGDAVSAANGELRWREATLDQGYTIDFNELIGRETTHSVAYAVCYIHADTEHRGLVMLVGSDDEAKVYLNGEPVHKHTAGRAYARDEDIVQDITLSAGLNILVFKVVNENQGWQGAIRFTDAEGNPVEGIKVTLAP